MEKNRYPKFQNYGQLLRELHSEQLLKEYLAYMRWGNEPCCIHCQQPYYVRAYSKPGFYECSSCKIQFSVLQGTIFERTHIPLDIWFWALFEFCIENTPSTKVAVRHTIQQNTAWRMQMRIKETLWEELNRKLSGTIYCDETELGADPQWDIRVYYDKKKREKRGLPPDHTMSVFGMLEAGIANKAKPRKKQEAIQGGKLILLAVDDVKLNTLQCHMIRKTDSENSKFITDGAPSYYDFRFWCLRHYILVKKKFGKYDYKRHVRKVNDFTLELATDEEIAAGKYITLTNNPIENVWSKLCMDYRRHYGFSKEYAQMYLNEFMFRWNHMHLSIGEKFQILLQRSVNTPLYSGFGMNRKKVTLTNKFARRPKRKGYSGTKWKTLP